MKNTACGGADSNYLDNAFTESADSNGDGTPETGWSPGPNKSSSPSDAKAGDAAPSSDKKTTKPDGKVTAGDGPAATEKGPAADGKPKADLNRKAPTKDNGCACSTPGSGRDPAAAALVLGLLVALLAWRRRA